MPNSTAHLVLIDHDALAMIEGADRAACLHTAMLHYKRIQHFASRITERGQTGADVIITVLNGDDPVGARVARLLMPPNWEAPLRAKGMTPFARGLALRTGMQEVLEDRAPETAATMKAIEGIVVLVADHCTINVFSLTEIVPPN
jgi:hypothetical protein